MVGNEFENVPGVDQINTPAKSVKTLLNVTKWIRWAFFILAGVLLASSLFLIVNTIRLATFARRREIEVMKLVGASNWFVRVPFMAEGLVQGAIGAGLAFGLVYFLKWLITNLLKNQHSLLQPFYVSSHDVVGDRRDGAGHRRRHRRDRLDDRPAPLPRGVTVGSRSRACELPGRLWAARDVALFAGMGQFWIGSTACAAAVSSSSQSDGSVNGTSTSLVKPTAT